MKNKCRIYFDDMSMEGGRAVRFHYMNKHEVDPVSECSGCGEKFISIEVQGNKIIGNKSYKKKSYCPSCCEKDKIRGLIVEEVGYFKNRMDEPKVLQKV